MEQSDIIRGLRAFIQARFKISESDRDFNDDVNLFDYGYVDSFGAVELIEFVKKEYSVEISNSDLIGYPMNTITEIASFGQRRLKGEI